MLDCWHFFVNFVVGSVFDKMMLRIIILTSLIVGLVSSCTVYAYLLEKTDVGKAYSSMGSVYFIGIVLWMIVFAIIYASAAEDTERCYERINELSDSLDTQKKGYKEKLQEEFNKGISKHDAFFEILDSFDRQLKDIKEKFPEEFAAYQKIIKEKVNLEESDEGLDLPLAPKNIVIKLSSTSSDD